MYTQMAQVKPKLLKLDIFLGTLQSIFLFDLFILYQKYKRYKQTTLVPWLDSQYQDNTIIFIVVLKYWLFIGNIQTNSKVTSTNLDQTIKETLWSVSP